MAIYVYGLIRTGVPLPTLPQGISPDVPIHVISEGEVAAVSHAVPEREFNNETLEVRFQDLIWLEGAVQAHEAIVETVMRTTPILPMRFCTVYMAEEGIRQTLRRYGTRCIEALDFLNNKAEWGLKVFCDREVVRRNILEEDETIRQRKRAIEGKPAGTTYLLRKRVELVCLTRTEEEIERLINTVEIEVETFGIERFLHETICMTDENRQIILNISYLVVDDRVDDLIERVQEINDRYGKRGIRCILSGPWPPYGFTGRLFESETISHRETSASA
ncbi:MAG: GvpL/GvpF family gas vesicle protein [Candidatus Latescibacteria bacterium]|nr:GvpL/GvpF family gas vesicle protein [Candidatus Latescibacterota bacterium]